MGDRGNVKLVYENKSKIYIYSHWTRSELPQLVANALHFGESRWDDEQYLARVIFQTVIDNDDGVTNYGLSPYRGDGDDTVTVYLDENEVANSSGDKFTFRQWVDMHLK